jgi:hypothetical protein
VLARGRDASQDQVGQYGAGSACGWRGAAAAMARRPATRVRRLWVHSWSSGYRHPVAASVRQWRAGQCRRPARAVVEAVMAFGCSEQQQASPKQSSWNCRPTRLEAPTAAAALPSVDLVADSHVPIAVVAAPATDCVGVRARVRHRFLGLGVWNGDTDSSPGAALRGRAAVVLRSARRPGASPQVPSRAVRLPRRHRARVLDAWGENRPMTNT